MFDFDAAAVALNIHAAHDAAAASLDVHDSHQVNRVMSPVTQVMSAETCRIHYAHCVAQWGY